MKDGKFQLVRNVNADSETKIAEHKKKIRVYENGIRKAGAELFGYAFLQGRELLAARELLPHGEFMPWVEQNFPDLPHRTATHRITFAEAVTAKLATVANLETGKGGPKPLLITNGKKLNKKEQEAVLNVVPEIMDGKTMTEFMRGAKFVKDKEKPAYHPPADPTPGEKAEAELQQAEALVTALIGDIGLLMAGDALTKVSPATRAQLLAEGIALNNKLRQMEEATKGKSK